MQSKKKTVVIYSAVGVISAVIGLWFLGLTGVRPTVAIDGSPLPQSVFANPEKLSSILTSGGQAQSRAMLPDGTLLAMSYEIFSIIVIGSVVSFGLGAVALFLRQQKSDEVRLRETTNQNLKTTDKGQYIAVFCVLALLIGGLALYSTKHPKHSLSDSRKVDQAFATQSIDELKAAASTGDVDAARKLGTMYFSGEAVPLSDTSARQWFSQASAAGDYASADKLATMFVKGLGGDADPRQAFEVVKKFAEDGNEEAMARLSDFYERGVGTSVDKEWASVWARKSLSNLDGVKGEALLKVSDRRLGLKIIRQREESGRSFIGGVVVASKKGDPEAQHDHANYILWGWLPGSQETAVELLKASASKGYPAALYTLAGLYNDAHDPQLFDPSTASDYLYKAAVAGHAEASYEYALLLASRDQGEGDPGTYIKYLAQAAVADHSDAQWLFGKHLVDNTSNRKDEGWSYVRQAAQELHPEARRLLENEGKRLVE